MHRFVVHSANASENREEWLAIRRSHVTATDWPKITGSSRWGSACDVVADKRYGSEYEDWPTPLPMRVGSDLEPLIINEIKK